MIRLEETFYVNEQGFDFLVETGLVMTGFNLGDVRSVLKRPGGSVVNRVIPVVDVLDPAKGIVLMSVDQGDLSLPGMYEAQIFFKNGSLIRPSHVFKFEVGLGLVQDPANLFS